MKVLVCGSRSFRDEKAVRAALKLLPRGTKIIHGDARGADKLAATVAASMGFEVEAFPADWTVHPHTPEGQIRTKNGRSYNAAAGHERNLLMLGQDPDLVIAFWDGRSTGTKHTIDEARKRGIRVVLL